MGLHLSKWLRLLPRGRYMVAGVIVAVVPMLVNLAGGAEAIKLFFLITARDFGTIQPFNLIPLYIDSYLACDHTTGIESYNCDNARFLQLFRPIKALLDTVGVIIEGSGWSQALVLVLALALGYFLALALIKRLFRLDEANVLAAIGACLLAPVAGSLVALVLQWVAIGLFYLLGTLIGAIIFFLSVLAVPIKIAKTMREAEDTARSIQTLHEMTQDPKPPGPN